jgi:ABC-type nickel/cobalt efflux system permease component RcnA
MAPEYYYMWEFVTSLTIIILIAAYIIFDKVKQRFESLNEEEKNMRALRLTAATQLILGILAVIGGASWAVYMKTVKIYISPELEGFHNFIPPIVMGAIGLTLLVAGVKKFFMQRN